jgi:antitoxin MazE
MIKTLTKHGNSYALIIDKAILELLNIGPDSPLELTTDGKALTVAPVTDTKRRQKFEKAVKQTNRRYGKALKKLAQ